jgi:hypothetical protein
MNPTPSDVHVNRPLTNISVAYIQDQTRFVTSKIFPNIPVQKKSDQITTWSKDDWNRDEMRERAPATESAGGGYRPSTPDSYLAIVYAFHKDVDDQTRSNADQNTLDEEATRFVTMKGLLRRERLWINKFFKTGVWGTNYTGVASAPTTGQTLQWNDAASDPVMVMRRLRTNVGEATGGFEPNTLVLGRRAWDALYDHPDIIDRIKYGGTPGAPAIVARQAIAALLEIDNIYVLNAVENTAAEGLTGSHSFMAGNHALFCHVAPNPGLMTPSAGYTFSWNGYLGAAEDGQRISQFRMENIRSDRVEIEMAFDQKLVGADLGVFIQNVVATPTAL